MRSNTHWPMPSVLLCNAAHMLVLLMAPVPARLFPGGTGCA